MEHKDRIDEAGAYYTPDNIRRIMDLPLARVTTSKLSASSATHPQEQREEAVWTA